VVGVEEEVQHDGVEEELKGEPGAETHAGAAVVGEEDGEDGSDGGSEFDGEEDFVDADVRDGVADVFVAVEEANSVGGKKC
jgi:hypothetical protein